MSFSVSDTVSTAQADLEKLVTDLRGLLASKELDAVPDIHVLRQRLDDGISHARDSAVRAARKPPARPRTPPSPPTVTPTTNPGAWPVLRWPWARWWALLARR
jgi:hypothetical protein